MRIKIWALNLKRDVITVWIASKDRRMPFAAKFVAAITAAYAFSPIDLIPDFIPIVGYLDDLLLVPAGIWLTLRLTPKSLIDEYRQQAEEAIALPSSLTAAIVIVLIWLLLIVLVWIWMFDN